MKRTIQTFLTVMGLCICVAGASAQTVGAGPETIAAYSRGDLQQVIRQALFDSFWVVFSNQNGDGGGRNTLFCNGRDMTDGLCNWQANQLAQEMSAPGSRVRNVWLMLCEEETTNDPPFDAPGLSVAQQDYYRSGIQPFVDAGLGVVVVVAGEEGIKDEHRSGAWSVAKITQHAQWIKSTWPGVETALHNWPGSDDAGDKGPDGHLYWKVDFHDFAWDGPIDWFCIQTDISNAVEDTAYWRMSSNRKICLAEVGPWQIGVRTDDELAQGDVLDFGPYQFTERQAEILQQHIIGPAADAVVFYPGLRDQATTINEWNPEMQAFPVVFANYWYEGECR